MTSHPFITPRIMPYTFGSDNNIPHTSHSLDFCSGWLQELAVAVARFGIAAYEFYSRIVTTSERPLYFVLVHTRVPPGEPASPFWQTLNGTTLNPNPKSPGEPASPFWQTLNGTTLNPNPKSPGEPASPCVCASVL
jgi:hypothetical protein